MDQTAITDDQSIKDYKESTPTPRSNFWVKCALVISTIWGLALIGLFIYFLVDKKFKNLLLEFSQEYGTISFVNVSLMIFIETVLLMLGFSAAIPEICFAFFLKNYLATFIIIAVARQLATIFAYFIGKYVFKQAMDLYMQNFKIYICLKSMLKMSPYKTISIIRFSMMPNFVKYYGLPALDPPFWKLNVFVIFSTAIQAHCYLLLGFFARSESEIRTGEFSNSTLKMLGIGCGVFYGLMLFALFVVIYQEMKKLEKASNAKIEERLLTQEERKGQDDTRISL